MTPAEQFKLVAKILKQYEPFSDERCAAQAMIKFYQETYTGNMLRIKLEGLLETATEYKQGVDNLWQELFPDA